MKVHNTTVVIGAQYGSEGKGVVVHRMALDNKYDAFVRVGGPNAGHSFIHRCERYTVQSVPVGFVDPDALLILGAGAVINPRVLQREVEMLESRGFNIRDRLHIDRNAALILPQHEDEEGHTKGELHQRIGSTGEGVGAARRCRIRRHPGVAPLVKHRQAGLDTLGTVGDTAHLLSRMDHILLEGTQGVGLSLIHGPWPYTTSADTGAAQLCADAGIGPSRVGKVMLVARTYPIRVGGNSGPLENEMDWDYFSEKLGRPTIERTTVTKKVRRIGAWDWDLFKRAVMLNGPMVDIALTFLDYLNPEDEFVQQYNGLSETSRDFIEKLAEYGPIRYIGTGMHERRGWTCVRL